ncbi:hypothetical protein OH77DRAFT_1437767 [Trametes cingulata]|nr:hypothetical protein OH77DRAFT_1437767 [Trametes cingulata]
MSTNRARNVTFASPLAYYAPTPSLSPPATPVPHDQALPSTMFAGYLGPQIMTYGPPTPYMGPVPLPVVGTTSTWACGASSTQNTPPDLHAVAWPTSTASPGAGKLLAAVPVNITALAPVAAAHSPPIHSLLQPGGLLWDVRIQRLRIFGEVPQFQELAFADAVDECLLNFYASGSSRYRTAFDVDVRVGPVKGGIRVWDVLVTIDQVLHHPYGPASISDTDVDLYGRAVAARGVRLGHSVGPGEGWERVDAFTPSGPLLFMGLRAEGPGNNGVMFGNGTQQSYHH